MSYLKFEQTYIRKKSEKIPVSNWVLDEKGQLIGFDVDFEEAVKEAGIRLNRQFDKLLAEAFLEKRFDNDTATHL